MWIAIQNAIGARQGVGGSPQPGPSNLLLDDYPNAAAAYSVRKLSSSYAGTALRVRRTVAPFDEQDIGFDGNGDLDTAAIIAFGVSNPLTVSRWYDQSSNDNRFVQINATQQPQIYDGSVVITESGKPALSFDGGDTFTNTILTLDADAVAFVAVGTVDTIQDGMLVKMGPASNRFYAPVISTGNIGVRWGDPAQVNFGAADTSQHLYSVYGTSSADTAYQDGSAQTLSSRTATWSSEMTIGGFNNNQPSWIGNAQEVIVWDADKSSDRTGIESNINGYYSIYPTSGLLADYPGAAVAYSVRQLSNTATLSMRVRRTVAPFDEQDIGFDSNGDLDTAAISTFGGSDPLTVSVWYDQSGQSRHATQGTAGSQPQIYNGAAVLTQGGNAVLNFENTKQLFTTLDINATAATSFHVGGYSSANNFIMQCSDDNNTFYGVGENGSTASAENNVTVSNYYINSSQVTSPNRDKIYDGILSQGLLTTLYSASTSDQYVFNYNFSSFGYLQLQEVIIYHSDESSNRTGIESDINGYFNVYTEYNPDAPTSGFLFDYSGASAAYSIRQLNNNATTAMRVRRTVAPFDEQDIGFDSNGDLDTAAITSFGGSDEVVISRFYDQTGDQNHTNSIAASAELLIYDGASVLTKNGKPIGQSHATSGISSTTISMTNSTGLSFTHSLYTVGQRPNAPYSVNMFGTTASGVTLYQERGGNLTYGPGWTPYSIYTYPTVNNTPRLWSYIRKNGTDGECFNDGVSRGTTTAMNASIQVDIKSMRMDRNTSGVQADCGGVQEFIAYPDDRTAVGDNANILTNIKTYFTGIP